jgi:putative ABC transport system ATP-binding protein
MSDLLVKCSDLARTYGAGVAAVVAVHGVNCYVTAPSRIALTGPSGCGKSTLLHLMAGLETPTTGTVEWPGLAAVPPNPHEVGLVFQSPNLLPDLDITENVALPLLLAGASEAEAAVRAMRALERLGIEHLACDLPDELSGGQAQRAGVARALVAGPRLILADEPTGQLDRDTAQQVVAALLEAADSSGAGLVIATHDDAVADRLPTRWSMRDGALSGQLAAR